MKFGANLQAHLTPEWRSQYIDYEILKGMLCDWKEDLLTSQQTDIHFTVHTQEITQRQLASFEDQFFAECDVQLTKVNTFFAEKLAEATRRFALLQSEIQAHKQNVLAVSGVPATTSLVNRRKSRAKLFLPNSTKEKVHHKTLKDLKFAYSEFYLSLILLQNYQELNFTGFRKILKKHDKILDTDKGAKWRKNFVITAPFHSDSFISEYILKTENLFINELEHGDRSKAMKRLRVPPLTDKRTYPKGTVFRVGLFLGMFLTMVVVFTIAAIFLPVPELFLTFKLYRGGFVLFLFMACLGFNIWGWRAAGVNHVLIFEIDPRQYLSHQHFFEIASLFSIIWSFSIICYIFGFLPELQPYFPVYLNPGLVYSCYFLFLINPFPILFHKARFWLIRRLWRLFACGFYPVEFADFWLADQLNSLVVLFLDTEFIICFYGFDGDIWNGRTGFLCGSYSYGVRAIVTCYPAYIRFVQCLRRYYDTRKWFPHLINAGKYSTTFFRVTFNALYVLHRESTQELQSVYFFLWLASLFISSCYTYVWDIKMDWGFLDSNAGENKFLREEIVYPYKAFYYFAIIEDFVIRFSWIVRVGVEQLASSDSSSLILSNVLAILEVLRRFIWNFFRLENEHLNNCGEFRAVRDISVTPLRADDLATLERMMDEVDGVEKNLLKEVKKKPLTRIPSFAGGIRRYYDTRKWFPHLINAGKYSTTFFRVTFNALYVLHRESTQELQSVYFFLWLASLFISSCYTYVWDIKMDWGFLDSNAGENKFLREEIVYPYKAFYYFAIIEDFVIRFSWIVRVGVEQLASSDSSSLILSNVLAILEVLRRFIWNFFRLENEHLNNCGEFRAVRDISVTPLRADDLATLERMMDEVDGVEKNLLKEVKKKPLTRIPSFAGGIRKNSSGVVLFVGDRSNQSSTSAV